MGHSYIDFQEDSILFQDSDLSFIMGSVVHQYDAMVIQRPQFKKLYKMIRWWLDKNSHPGPGCYDLKLDEYLQSDENRRLFLILIDSVSEELNMMNSMLSSEYLNERTLIDTAKYQKGVPKEYFINMVKKFRVIVSTTTII